MNERKEQSGCPACGESSSLQHSGWHIAKIEKDGRDTGKWAVRVCNRRLDVADDEASARTRLRELEKMSKRRASEM